MNASLLNTVAEDITHWITSTLLLYTHTDHCSVRKRLNTLQAFDLKLDIILPQS